MGLFTALRGQSCFAGGVYGFNFLPFCDFFLCPVKDRLGSLVKAEKRRYILLTERKKTRICFISLDLFHPICQYERLPNRSPIC